MKVMLLPSCVSRHASERQFLTLYLINDTVALDAGSLGFYGTPEEQVRIKHVLISHSHIDHIASLPIFLENAFEHGPECVTIYGSDAVLDCLRRDMFNDCIWPDLVKLSKSHDPFLKLELLKPRQPLELDGLRVTPVPVNHAVPTMGFLVEDSAAAVAISSDTGPTEEFWVRASAAPNLKAVFLEASFPDALTELAEVSLHLTPALFAREVRKLKQPARILAMHIKSRFREQVIRELLALGLSNLEISEPGKVYTF